MSVTKIITLFLSALAACPPPTPVKAPTEAPGCKTWCAHADELGCITAKPTKAGASCEEVCNNIQTSEFAVYDLPCRIKAASCETADQCERGR